ncbi:hypothetical protein D2V08_08095 [Flagellimonas lutimaris]|uniref:Uncharacterized protein n=1 Tax=Flagellimonas lutimaris TaxID=475082 RepID=A0A3A1NBF3_9FLAO|nr:hypothetical protein [Allomuricauda lutimaris]RIV35305.1 hypothetical protein D2V08_08095 [Allomuricauda lutimaris]|tara:strand:- start:242 stop:610 length:369 start_codon:yes stop_codon:yes gene_type:complete
MKIRIKGNSIRFRLTQSEVQQLSEMGSVKETAEFGPNVFQYQVKLMSSVQNLQASYSNNTILMMVPEADGKKWFHNDTIGFEHEMELSTGKKLHLLLEKDFTCLENRDEDQSDNYPNPKLQH